MQHFKNINFLKSTPNKVFGVCCGHVEFSSSYRSIVYIDSPHAYMNDNDPFSGWPSYLLQLAFIFVKVKMAVTPSQCLLAALVFLWTRMSPVSSLQCYQPSTTEDGFLSVFSSLLGSLAPTSSVLADCPENTNCIISGPETSPLSNNNASFVLTRQLLGLHTNVRLRTQHLHWLH